LYFHEGKTMKSKYNLLVIFFSFCALSPSAGYTDEGDWDINTAYRLAAASECSYYTSSKKSVRDCFKKHIDNSRENGKKALAIFQDLNDGAIDILTPDAINAAILVKTGDDLIIAFRGTELIPQDWGNNFHLSDFKNIIIRFFQRELNKIYENERHKGFNESLTSLTREIKEKDNWKSLIQNSSGKTLYLTGHSKGGALATGATVDYKNDLKDLNFRGSIVTYTFEAARFFTAAGIDSNSSKLNEIWRFEYQHDPVPHAPLGEITYRRLVEQRDKMLALEEKSSKTFGEIATLIANMAMFHLLGTIGLPYDEIDRNNFNFLPAGKLAYVDSENKLCLPNNQCEKYDEYKNYEERFKESVQKNAENANVIHPLKFLIDQHSEGYLRSIKNEIN
ncbi:MAG TPA: lipase family protein, partial [Nitrosomonas sp.]|nr:lipase family protein [Nitrosomonas sp.]